MSGKKTRDSADSGAGLEDIIQANLKVIARLEEENRKLRHDLNERKKELKGNYDIENIIDVQESFDEVMRSIAEVIPPSYQYPEATCARIIIRGAEFRTKNFIETNWKQVSVIRVSGRPEGKVEVCYTEKKPVCDEGPFLAEERKLIDKLALRIGKIAEKTDATDALRTSEDRFRKLVETTSDLIWEVDERGVYTYVSPKIVEVLGYQPEEVLGRKPFDFMPPDEGKAIAAVFDLIAAGKKGFRNLLNINLHKDGHKVTLETSGVPFFDLDGTFRGYRGIDRDITKRKKAEEELKKINVELQESLNKVRVLSGLLPICAACKRIRTEKGYWESIERYISKHSEAEFTHSICGECAEKLYPDVFPKKEE